MIKKDCFGYNELMRNCGPLKHMVCQDCNFYKTVDQHKADQRKAVKRLKSKGYVAVDGFVEIGFEKYPANWGW